MKRFRNILLVCDEGERHQAVIARAMRLAKANAARITLVDVVDAAPGELNRLFSSLPGKRSLEIEFEVLEFHRTRLAEVAAPFRAEGIETTELVLQGIPFIQIIQQVLRDGHDLVMKGVAGDSDGKAPFFASTDLHLLRKCPCPVWVMKGGGSPRFDRILAAVDPVDPDEPRRTLDTLVLDLAASLSAIEDSDLHVVHAWHLPEEASLRHSAFARVPKAEIDELVEERRKQSEMSLGRLMSGYREANPKPHIHLLKGEARDIIPEFAESDRIDLIVMGTVGRTGLRGLIIGNTAEAILNRVHCSVLAVKPMGFETPVGLDSD